MLHLVGEVKSRVASFVRRRSQRHVQYIQDEEIDFLSEYPISGEQCCYAFPDVFTVAIALANSVNCLCYWRDVNTASRLISDLDFQLINATSADSFRPKLGIGGSYGSNYRINFRAGI
jgi:hypothetical protein